MGQCKQLLDWPTNKIQLIEYTCSRADVQRATRLWKLLMRNKSFGITINLVEWAILMPINLQLLSAYYMLI